MKKILRFSKLEILCTVLLFFIFSGWTVSSYAASVTVDESAIRGTGDFKGPLPIMITAFAERFPGTPPTFNVLGSAYFFTLFDTGSTSIALSPGHLDYLKLLYPTLSLPKLLDVRINGMGTIDENTLYAPIGPPIGPDPQTQLVDVLVGSTDLKQTLIGAPMANVRVAYIDNRVRIKREPYPFLFPEGTPEDEQYKEGPDIRFFTEYSLPPFESIGKKKELTLRLEPFGTVGVTNEGATKGLRYYLRDVVFNDGGNQLSDLSDLGGGVKVQNLDFFWDSGTTYTAISQQMAESLGLTSRDPDFNCDLSDGTSLAGYVIDSVVMNGVGGGWEGNYTVQNARICVSNSSDPKPFGIAEARIGSNLFEQVPILFHGPYEYLQILSDFELKQGDFDGDGVVNCSDYDMLMAEIERTQPVSVSITGFTRIGFPSEIGNTIEIQYSASNEFAKIKSVTYDFTGKNVIYDPDQATSGDETQVFNFPEENGTIKDTIWFVDLDQLLTGTGTPIREDYIGGKVTVEIIDGTTTEAFFNTEDSDELAQALFGAAARFTVNIPGFLPPADLSFDLNEDGIVDQADVDMLSGLLDNPGDWPCDSGGGVPGDLDGDDHVDSADVNIIAGYRNQPASVCPECDIDGDGIITVLDMRKLVLLCTCPRCAPMCP